MSSKNSRCRGDCCRVFYLPVSPEELEAAYYRWQVAQQQRGVEFMSKTRGIAAKDSIIADIHLIYPMVTYLGKFKQPPYKTVLPVPNEWAHYYS